MQRRPAIAVLIGCLIFSACGNSPQAPPPAQPWNDPGYVSSGAWSLYYAAFPAHDLAPDLAREYGIAANPAGALVVVSIANSDHRSVPPDAQVTIHARTLSGTERDVSVKRVERNGAVSWLGELGVSRREMLVFSVSAKPDAETPAITAEFRRELYLE